MKFNFFDKLILHKLVLGNKVLVVEGQSGKYLKRLSIEANERLAVIERVYGDVRANDDPWLNVLRPFFQLKKGRRIYFLEATEQSVAALYMPPAGQVPEGYKGERLI